MDIEAGDRAVELIKPWALKAARPEVRGGLGGFAGLFALSDYRRPLLAASTDGVGTKLAIAQAMGKHDTIGLDLVGDGRRRPGGVWARRRADHHRRVHLFG